MPREGDQPFQRWKLGFFQLPMTDGWRLPGVDCCVEKDADAASGFCGKNAILISDPP